MSLRAPWPHRPPAIASKRKACLYRCKPRCGAKGTLTPSSSAPLSRFRQVHVGIPVSCVAASPRHEVVRTHIQSTRHDTHELVSSRRRSYLGEGNRALFRGRDHSKASAGLVTFNGAFTGVEAQPACRLRPAPSATRGTTTRRTEQRRHRVEFLPIYFENTKLPNATPQCTPEAVEIFIL